MDNEIAIEVDNVSKKFCKSIKRSMLYGMTDIGKNLLWLSSHSERLRQNEFWAVNDVSFKLKKGEVLGLIGPNGSGKSTLLKMLNGIFWPDIGKISVKGRVGALIEVGAGFHPLLTGRENIYVNAAILGMSKAEVEAKFDQIIEFADIGDFIDAPVKSYSSGMYVRLGFSVAAHCEPDILLIDEILSVGDAAFQAKCHRKISDLRKKASIILVSHSMPTIQHICDRCVVFDKGKVLYQGNVLDSVSKYFEIMSTRTGNIREDVSHDFADQTLEVKSLKITRDGVDARDGLFPGDNVEFVISLSSKGKISKPQVTLSFTGDTYSGFSTKYDSFNVPDIQGDAVVSLKVNYLGLGPGIYMVSIGVWDNDMLKNYYWNWEAATIVVKGSKSLLGRFEFPHDWKVVSAAEEKQQS
jgi:lipopolysaccharide transport system ATP-binding protein